jgi:hypothetical protein
MVARGAAWLVVMLLGASLSGCPGDPKGVAVDIDDAVFSTANSLVVSVKHEDWPRACSLLTVTAAIELEARIQREDRRLSRPSCEAAVSSAGFHRLCGARWKNTHLGVALYRRDDVDEYISKPRTAWTAFYRGARLTSRCELRLTREDSEDAPWRIDAISFDPSTTVVGSDLASLVFQSGDDATRRRPAQNTRTVSP